MLDFQQLFHECAPTVAPGVLRAIIRTESDFDPLALNINGPVRLTKRPRSVAEAASWAQWLIAQGYSVDVGLMQINSRNLAWLELTLIDAFDPCANIRAGGAILAAQYDRARTFMATVTLHYCMPSRLTTLATFTAASATDTCFEC